MRRFSHSQRDNVVLGYSTPQRSIANPSSWTKAQFRNSADDFRDVFGGPPRRSSIHEMRHRLNETMDSQGDEEILSSRSSWSGLREKPVFGEEGVNPRRRYPSDDFFDDIFRGDQSSSSTPRKPDRNSFSSAPGSRALSPARPLPLKAAEPFASSSFPAQFGLPAKLAKGMDFPAFASVTHSPCKSKDGSSNGIKYSHSPSVSLSRFSSQAILGQDESRNDVRPSYCQSPLSLEFSLSSEESPKVKKSDKTDTVGNLKKDSNSLAVPSSCNQFHFSIYKWASKGVPLVMPLRGGNSSRLKEKGKTQRCSSYNGSVKSVSAGSELATAMRDIDFHSLNSSILANTKSLMESEKKDNDSLLNTSTQDRVEPCQIVEEAVLAMPESKPLNSLQSTVENVPGILCNTREEAKPDSSSEIGLCEKTEKEISVFTQETRKPDLKPLRSLLYDNDDGQGNDVITGKAGRKESMVTMTKKSSVNVDVGKNVKKQDGKRIILNGAEVDKDSLQGSPINSGDNLGRNGIKGKVKEFVKIFNQEASSKPLINAGIRSQSRRWKGKGNKAENETSVSTTGTDGKMHMPNVNKKKTLPDASVMVDENLKQSEKQHSGINTTIYKIIDASGQEDNSAPSSESSPDGSTTPGNIDESFEGTFLIKELSQDQNKPPQTGIEYEEIQVSDAKIRQWSNGKEGNIRSLLSTLHYVLWSGSGWKPVPLVDIIEGNAVKRAYQKALLRLHPDKLQQKGAASHQKYVAEKVFDILQEAWTHFNSLGSL